MDNTHNHDQNTQQPQTQGKAQTPRRYVRPRASITENADRYTVQVEMPGVSRTGLEVTFENGELSLTGHRTPFQPEAETVYRESRPMDFRRVFELDSSIDTAAISAGLDQGLLTLSLPKSAGAQPRRIEVSGLN